MSLEVEDILSHSTATISGWVKIGVLKITLHKNCYKNTEQMSKIHFLQNVHNSLIRIIFKYRILKDGYFFSVMMARGKGGWGLGGGGQRGEGTSEIVATLKIK